jgi:hypothetical protein
VCFAPLTLSVRRLGPRTVDTFDQHLIHLPSYCCTEFPKACNYVWDLWLSVSSGSSRPPPGGHFTTKIFFAALTLYRHGRKRAHHRHLQLQWWPLLDLPPATHRGPAIDVFNFGGGRCRTCLPPATPRGSTIDISSFGGGHCRTCRQHPPPPGGSPSTSSTSMVAAAGHAASTPRGCHRCLQLWWWSLPDLPLAPPTGPPSTSSPLMVAAVGPAASTP